MRGATAYSAVIDWIAEKFQSTLPMRGATRVTKVFKNPIGFQSTLPMRGATQAGRPDHENVFISIHAPHAGSDLVHGPDGSRRPISIHAPHAGSDQPLEESLPAVADFNPRSPCGERLYSSLRSLSALIFQSTLPMRGATLRSLDRFFRQPFQSTLPMRGATKG